MTVRSPEAAPTALIDPAMRRRVIWSSTIGNALEWFDFTVFGLFAPTIGEKFFPGTDPTAALLKAYGLLAVAFFFRPIGGVVFGVWADRVGRKKALIVIVLSMALATFIIGILPTYAAIGVAAPILLLLARLVQGFSAGGEFGASTAMLMEFSPPDRRGFYASFQFVAQNLAFVIGAAFAFCVSALLTKAQAADWGWRLPFLFGIVVAPVGFYLRSRIDETPAFRTFLAERGSRPNTPFRDLLRRHPRRLLALLLVVAGATAFTYLANVFVTNFATTELKLRASDAQLGILLVNLVAAALLPFASGLSDRLGRTPVMGVAIVLLMALYLPLAHALIAEPSTQALWLMQSSGLIFMFISGPFAALSVESFPVGVRSTGASVMYNLGVALFGGLSPFLTGMLLTATGDRFSPFLYLAFCMALSLVGLALLPRGRSASPG